jgi:peptide deformylase
MIIKNNEEALRIKCSDANEEEAKDIIQALEKELQYSALAGQEGIGLAAVQIGIPKNIAIVRMADANINLVNCGIEKMYDPAMFRQEGCLSFPNRYETTTRHQEIVISNNSVYPESFIASGLIAVCCQHEIDHFSGKLFIDHTMKQVKRKVGPNDPCPCGAININTGGIKKFKKCCGA